MQEIVIEGIENHIDENVDVKDRTKDLPCENTLKGKSFFVNKVFLIIALRVAKPRFCLSAPNLPKTFGF